jgi:hypothetical protein
MDWERRAERESYGLHGRAAVHISMVNTKRRFQPRGILVNKHNCDCTKSLPARFTHEPAFQPRV